MVVRTIFKKFSLNISKNGKLNIFMGNPEKIISSLIKNKNIEFFSWNRLYDPYSINRDKKIKIFIKQKVLIVKHLMDIY